MTTLVQDVRYALRLLVRYRGFTAAAALVLALGTGATTTVFTITDALLFKPRVGRPDGQVVGLYTRDRSHPDAYRAFSYPDYAELRSRTDVFASLTAHNVTLAGLTEGTRTRRVLADIVTANYFDTFGAPVALGRAFTAEEERPGANIFVTILSDGTWRRMGANPNVVGQTIRLSGRSFTVVGVAARGFGGQLGFITPELWVPTGVHDAIAEDVMRGGTGTTLADREQRSLIVLARLKPGATIASALPAVQAAGAERAAAHADARDQELLLAPLSRLSISTQPTTDADVTGVSAALIVLAAIVLVIASFNLANMLLARGGARRKEIAVRLAIGGSRARIVRQLLVEGFVLSLVGGALGVVVATIAVRALVGVMAPVSPVSFIVDVDPDGRTLAAALAGCMLATLVFATLPAWKLARTDAVPELKDQSADMSARRGRLSIANLLVAGQIAFSLMMLTVAALAFRGALESASAEPGFSFARGVLVQMDANLAGYDTTRSRELYQRLLDRVRARPDVTAASMASLMPYGEISESRGVQKAGALIRPDDPRAATNLVDATFTSVSDDYFASLGLGMIAGREFDQAEGLSSQTARVAVIDEPLARRLFGDANPVGQAVQDSSRENNEPPVALTVVGVAPGLRDNLSDQEPRPHVYVPYGVAFRTNAYLHVRTAAPDAAAESALLPELRRELTAQDADLPILSVQTLAGWRSTNTIFALTRVFAAILGTFGAAALLLATVGLYGLKAYVVSRRTREIGIRVALGATPSRVVWLVVREGLVWSAIGLVIGAGLSVAAGVGMRAVTYQSRGADPVVLAAATLVLVSAGLVATWLPAWRATRIAPTQAIRNT